MRNPEIGVEAVPDRGVIKRYQKGSASLAKTAELAGVSIMEIIFSAYSNVLELKYYESLVESKIALEVTV